MKRLLFILLVLGFSNISYALYSYAWMRSCAGGGSEYFSYIEDGGHCLISYQGCDGGFSESFYANYNPDTKPFTKGNRTTNEAFNIMIKAYKDVIEKNGYTEKDLNIAMTSALKKAVTLFGKGGKFINSNIGTVKENFEKRIKQESARKVEKKDIKKDDK